MVLRPLRIAVPSFPESELLNSVCGDMSTQVFNPFAFTEVSRICAMGRRPPIDASALARVRRDLFGPVDHEDTRKFVMQELAAQQSLSSDRWGFDFQREEPIKTGPGSGKFSWEKVTVNDHVPQAYAHHEYTLTSETITAIAEEADVSAAAPTPPASPLEAASSTCPSTSSPEVETAKPTIRVPKSTMPSIKRTSNLRTSMKRRRDEDVQQKKMTDFLRIRKGSPVKSKMRRISEPVAPVASSQTTRS